MLPVPVLFLGSEIISVLRICYEYKHNELYYSLEIFLTLYTRYIIFVV
jgi:hypothetical protein